MGQHSPATAVAAAAAAAPSSHPPLPPVPPAVTVRAASVLPGQVSFGPFPEQMCLGGTMTADLALGLYCCDTRDTHYVLQVRYCFIRRTGHDSL